MTAVEHCFISSDVYLVCMHHALSTEVEEVMGLLIGWTNEKNKSCHISHTLLLKRLDKRKDRVEISPELLSSSITVCEELNNEREKARQNQKMQKQLSQSGHTGGKLKSSDTGCSRSVSFQDQQWPPPAVPEEPEPYLRVVGWYHSHPHITVFPSDVDLRTQEQYQTGVDPMWIGLIFGVYNSEESTGINHFQHIAFQSIHSGSNRLIQRLIPVIIEPCSTRMPPPIVPRGMPALQNAQLRPVPNLKALNNLESSFSLLMEEEFEAYEKAKQELERSSSSFAGPQQQKETASSGVADALSQQQLICILSKNICKIISLLGTPLLDALLDMKRPVSPIGPIAAPSTFLAPKEPSAKGANAAASSTTLTSDLKVIKM